jgi:hypothetical protein
MSAAFADQASECSEEAMAEQGSSKRARREIDVKPFSQLDLTQIKMKDNGKGKNGHLSYPLIDSEPIRFNLTPSDWVRTPFGFDIDGKYEKPSFLGGKAPEVEGISESLSLRLEVPQEQADFLTALDSTCKEAFLKIAEGKWNDLVTTNPVFKNSMVKIGVVLKGRDLTKIAIVVDGKVERGEGWSFIEPFFKRCNGFRNADIKMSAKIRKLWNVAGKAGLGLEATHLVLRPTERPVEKDPFGDDNELLA